MSSRKAVSRACSSRSQITPSRKPAASSVAEGPQFGRVSPAGRTVMLGLADALEHLAERQAQQYGDHGPDEETARDPQDPHISPKAPR